MLRAVLAVALAVALVAAVTPALDAARATRTERLTDRELGRVASAAASLAGGEAPGARRVLTVSLPAESPVAAGLDVVVVGGVPGRDVGRRDGDGNDVFAYRVAGRRLHVERVEVDLRVVRGGDISDDDADALALDAGGTYRVTLRLVRLAGRRQVAVSVRRLTR